MFPNAMKRKHHIIAYVIFFILLSIFVSLVFFIPGLREFFSLDSIRDFVLAAGVFAFVVYIVLLTLSVPVPIPSSPVLLAGGYIFGTWLGSLLGLIGIALGSTAFFFIGRFGRKSLIKKMVDEHHLKHFDVVFRKRGPSAALISYAIPIFPADLQFLYTFVVGIDAYC